MTTTPKLGIPLISGSQAQPEVTHNIAVLVFQAMLGGALNTQNAPPGSPADGDCYVVGPAGTGAWNSHDDAIAIFFGGWIFVPGVDDDGVQIAMGADQAGLSIYENTLASFVVWDGAAWNAAGGGGGASFQDYDHAFTAAENYTIPDDANSLSVHAVTNGISFTVTMPAAPSRGQQIVIYKPPDGNTYFTTFAANAGQSIVTAPGAFSTGNSAGMIAIWNLATLTWYCMRAFQ